MTKRFWGVLAYVGTRYAGFQRQTKQTPTIQSTVEDAIAQVTQQPVSLSAAGRTDAGVHARGQVIAFDCVWYHNSDALWRAINACLPQDIALHSLNEAPAGFHPRYDAKSRRYVYQFYTAPVREPLWDMASWHAWRQPLDLATMSAAAEMLLGTHDFATFGQPTQGTVTIRNLYQARIQRGENGLHQFVIEANAFLQRMVRSIMGTLVEVGRGRRDLAAFREAFLAADRRQAGETAPPHGLILDYVDYGTALIPR